jgi:hypothetical protein
MRTPCPNDTPPEKLAILRRPGIDRGPASDLGDADSLAPILFYAAQRRFFEKGAADFPRQNGSAETSLGRTIAALRDQLQPDRDGAGPSLRRLGALR